MNLIEHANKLLTRLKGANVASLEVRLKKQNLPGDVGHLAKSTVKDIVSLDMTWRFKQLILS